jgi:sterol desaturase/sphingolipid hydroxylase (fatty acid hydroxylase superfamily)
VDASVLVVSLYFGALVGGFAIVGAWETLAPARPARAPLRERWTANLGLLALNHGILPFLLPVSNGAAAWYATERGWGFMNVVALPPAAAFALTLVALDAVRYGNHRLWHRVPVLWRLHRVHHSDVDYDLTVGLRFHPIEAIAGNVAVIAAVVALGAPVWAVIASDVATVALGYFAHGNVRVPAAVDRALRALLVTPAMHSTHHSVERDEAMSNFGSVLSVWDRLFRTYRDRARAGDAIAFGLADERDPSRLGIVRLLGLPFAAPGRP